MSQTSNDSLPKWYYWITAIWLAMTILMARYFVAEDMKPFDPDAILLSKSATDIVDELRNSIPNLPKRAVVHISSPQCSCNQIVRDHKIELKDKLTQQGYTNIESDLTPKLASIIPSSPAVAIVEEGKLVYIGPYSAGYTCSSENSFVEIALNNINQGFLPEMIVSDINGCYCLAKKVA